MESLPLHKRNVGRDDERISALPDDLLLGILERLELREAVRAGAVSTRWRHLAHRLSRLHLNGRHFRCTTLLQYMDAFTGAARSLLTDRDCDCNGSHAVKSISLRFFLSAPHLSSIGRAVEHVVSRGETKRLHFGTCSPYKRNTALQLAEFGQQFMSFSRDYPLAFRWLTRLTLKNLAFGHPDVTDLISACDRLTHLTLSFCQLVDEHTPLKINTPCSGIKDLEFIQFGCTQIELISVPKLSKVQCTSWRLANPPVRFGYVPELCNVSLTTGAMAWQAPFLLSKCLSGSAMNLSRISLNFCHQMIWIQPEHLNQLAAIFRNLGHVSLFGIFPECDLSWTLFILDAAPALFSLTLSRTRHSCVETPKDSAEKTTVVWEPSKDSKNLKLKFLLIFGFEEEDKVINYIRLVMERAVGLKRIELDVERPCEYCKDTDLESATRSQVDEASSHRIRERLAHGSSSLVEIIINVKSPNSSNC
ncbi:hypothetical protein CFC21_075075 [Triticum aestivum]|uniref:F-box domain-containing protein n=2 Tax=Triticum aestivum TaxID=4565 RepID=A0A3B6LYD0_WHEAT|nr:uncharacterized protein LOC123115326 [Triticum aestivum]KAF7069445.1 hypothetical protein CFC21_075075 [Triticum aestivum]